jgi:D-glycero-D-manno-heptose 1,7-bisphosphate phosphatase
MPEFDAVIFDRDGTLIEHVPYLSDANQVRLLDGVKFSIRRLHDAGVRLFLHTNQSGVGRGMFELEAVHECNRRLVNLLGLGDHVFERICIAPEPPDAPSTYRKPSPAFVNEIIHSTGIPPQRICYVGDRASDLQTAAAAGTDAIAVDTGQGDLAEELRVAGLENRYPVVPSFTDAVDLIIGRQYE